MDYDEEVLTPDLIGLATPEGQKVREWRPPGPKQKQLKMRVFRIQSWIEAKNRFMEEEEIIRFSMMTFNVNRETARSYLKIVVDEFKRVGVPVLGE